VTCVDRKTDIIPAVKRCDARVIHTGNLTRFRKTVKTASIKNRFGFDILVYAVTAVCETDIGPVKALLFIGTVIVAEKHYISAFVADNSRVKSQRG
jgi:hypothetical protein